MSWAMGVEKDGCDTNVYSRYIYQCIDIYTYTPSSSQARKGHNWQVKELDDPPTINTSEQMGNHRNEEKTTGAKKAFSGMMMEEGAGKQTRLRLISSHVKLDTHAQKKRIKKKKNHIN